MRANLKPMGANLRLMGVKLRPFGANLRLLVANLRWDVSKHTGISVRSKGEIRGGGARPRGVYAGRHSSCPPKANETG